MSNDIFSATMRKTPGRAKLRLWFAALAITSAFAALVVLQFSGIARIVFGLPTAMVFIGLIALWFHRRKLDRRISALVTHAIATGQGIRAKRAGPSTSIHEVWVGEDEENKMRVTEWVIGVLRATPGVELIGLDEP